MKVAVAGATGLVGQLVAKTLHAQSHEVVPLTRGTGVDLMKGNGLAGRLNGVDAVIDVLNISTQRRAVAEEFFTTTTRRLLEAEADCEVRHHVTLSIVGIDLVPLGYYQGKLAQEQALSAGSSQWSLLRATQFYEFAQQSLDFMKLGPVSLVPRMLSQPVAASEVAAMLVGLAVQQPVGRAPDLAGPEPMQMVDLARRVSKVRGIKRRVVPISMPGAAGRAMRDGSLLPQIGGQPATVGSMTVDDWLEQ